MLWQSVGAAAGSIFPRMPGERKPPLAPVPDSRGAPWSGRQRVPARSGVRYSLVQMEKRPCSGAALCLLALLLRSPAAAARAGAEAPAATAQSGTVTVVHAQGDAGYARAVAALAASANERIRADLGLAHPVETAVLLLTRNSPAATREEWARRLPAWIAGAALPARQLIVIRVPPGQTPNGLEPLLAHELTHVILKADYPGHDGWPLWFQEGLAMRESRSEGVREYLTLSAAALFDRMLSLESLRAGFPAAEADARLAYAQSASFLAFLDASYGRGRFAVLMRELRGRSFEAAFRAAYGAGIGTAERDWRRWVNRRFAWVPALTSDAALWLLITLLFLVAIVVRRRRSRLMRERWEEEEETDEEEEDWPLRPT